MDEISINVLGCQNERGWEAVALEMDLIADGSTFEEALESLRILIENQVSFASFKKQPDMAFKAAPIEYFSLFAQIKHDVMRRAINNTVDESPDYLISGIPMPSAHVIAEMTKDFSRVNASLESLLKNL